MCAFSYCFSCSSQGHVARSMTCIQLHKRAERIAALITEKLKLNSGDHLALLYPPGLELVCAFYGCLYVGVVPVVIRPPTFSNILASVPTIKITLQISNARAILTCNSVLRIIKSKEVAPVLDIRSLPPMTPTDEVVKKKFEKYYKAPTAELIAYLDFSVSTTGILNGVKVSIHLPGATYSSDLAGTVKFCVHDMTCALLPLVDFIPSSVQ